MFTLYLDNFRNFYNTHIDFKDVNFLVGENSTGKSSLLSLINLISDQKFWLQFNFYNQFVDLRLFRDFAIEETSDNFKFGFYSESESLPLKNGSNSEISALLVSFKNDDGLPEIDSISIIKDNTCFKVLFNEGKTLYRAFPLNNRLKSVRKKFDLLLNDEEDDIYKEFEYKKDQFSFFPGYRDEMFILYGVMRKYYNDIKIKKRTPILLNPFYIEDLGWINPIRSKPKRTYDRYVDVYSPEGEHTPYELDVKLEEKRFKNSLKRFGKNSHLFESINRRNYSKKKFSPFEIQVMINDNLFNIMNVGYGVSQVLPILSEIISSSKGKWHAIQQPEVHLHPKAQASLGNLFFNSYLKNKNKFLIETHSDFVINRFRMSAKSYFKRNKNSSKKFDAQLLFFERNKNGNKIHSINIGLDGKYSSNQPKSFREFFLKEQLSLLNL